MKIMQMQEQKAAANRYNVPEVIRRSTETDYNRTMKHKETLKTMIDKVDIVTEIFCSDENSKIFDNTESKEQELDLPVAWDKKKVLKVIDDMRLKGTHDMNIRIQAISTDDLNILAEIANKLLHDLHELRFEINQLMSKMLSEAAIITSQPDKVGVNIKILDRKESAPFHLSLQFDVNLRQQIKLSVGNMLDCVIVRNKLVFTDISNEKLLVYNNDGSSNRDIKLSAGPCFVSVLSDDNVAVSYKLNYIEIISVNMGRVRSVIGTNGQASGIAHHNELLYVVIDKKKIDIMFQMGEIVGSFPCPSESIWIIETNQNKLFLAEAFGGNLYCCTMNGEVIWKFSDDNMRFLLGVAADSCGNLFMTLRDHHTVVSVTPDGKHNKEILTRRDGMNCPTGIYYDKSNDCMLVCNQRNGDAFLYDIKHQN
ncbi:Hypothetical predicted protein [Mytilus galloprovincialis]|uniref:Uncharacterized protein n=1 Tax=Mytilus galloprovincialis TaxID=29158 RepID=A0A8B6BTG4_MYTGA|nr:Hypothetical predicted protein [Mytilus galloprovincialis]